MTEATKSWTTMVADLLERGWTRSPMRLKDWQSPSGAVTVQLDYQTRRHIVRLRELRTDPDRRQVGEATAALQDLAQFAQRNGITLEAFPGPLPGEKSPGMGKSQLEQWYSSFGFKPANGRNMFVRPAD